MQFSLDMCSPVIDGLEAMPDDVILDIFSSLSSFSDVFSFALSCQRMTRLLNHYAPTVYRQLAPLDIEKDAHARALLHDQKRTGGSVLSPNSLSVQDVRRLVRNSRKATKSSERFGREIALHTRDTSSRERAMHPPELSSSEKSRFIRAYYCVWGLLCLPASAWPERLSHLPLRHIVYVEELSRLPQPFENEDCPYLEQLPDDAIRSFASHQTFSSYPFTSKRREVQEKLRSLIAKRSDAIGNLQLNIRPTFNFDWWNTNYKKREIGGWGGFVVLWDHFQQELMYMGLQGRTKSYLMREVGRKIVEEEIWGETDDEQGAFYFPRFIR